MVFTLGEIEDMVQVFFLPQDTEEEKKKLVDKFKDQLERRKPSLMIALIQRFRYTKLAPKLMQHLSYGMYIMPK